jgi:hypothetical protein
MRRIEIVSLAKKAAMVGWMPVLTGIDALPGESQQFVDVRHDDQRARHRQFGGAPFREALLNIDDEQDALGEVES